MSGELSMIDGIVWRDCLQPVETPSIEIGMTLPEEIGMRR